MSIMKDSREATMVGRRSDGSTVRRPLSPHLQVYDMLQMTSALSISHRITGVVWTAGVVVMVWWLVAAASGPSAFAWVQWFLGSFLGILLLMGVTAAAWYHTLAGIRLGLRHPDHLPHRPRRADRHRGPDGGHLARPADHLVLRRAPRCRIRRVPTLAASRSNRRRYARRSGACAGGARRDMGRITGGCSACLPWRCCR